MLAYRCLPPPRQSPPRQSPQYIHWFHRLRYPGWTRHCAICAQTACIASICLTGVCSGAAQIPQHLPQGPGHRSTVASVQCCNFQTTRRSNVRRWHRICFRSICWWQAQFFRIQLCKVGIRFVNVAQFGKSTWLQNAFRSKWKKCSTTK